MAIKTVITIDDIYKALKYHDLEILKHFNDENLTDQQYLFYAINNDIISNALFIVANMQIGNLESIGIDNCCRTIIEAFVVLKMIAKGDISDGQAKIFRYHYAIVDFANMRKLVTDEVKQTDDFKYVERDRKKAYEALLNFHQCTASELRNNPDFDDSNFYLKKHLEDKINFSALLEQYPIFDVKEIKMYEFFSIFVHPRFEKDSKIEEAYSSIRAAYIKRIIDYIVSFLKNAKLFVFDKEVTSFEQDYYKNPILQNNILNMKDMNLIFDSIEQKICFFDEGYDSFTLFFLEKMRSLIADMELSITLGYREHIISIFKSAIEYIAIYSTINECSSLEDFKKIKLAYCYSSRLQIDNLALPKELLKEAGFPDTFIEETISEFKQLFNDYYKEKYELDNFEYFLDKTRHNARYFLNKSKSSYNGFVNKMLDDLYANKSESDFIKMIYKISKDMNHGGGYSFNSSPGLIDSQCRHVQITLYRYMYKMLAFAALTLKEHGKEVDLRFELKYFEVLSKIHQNEIDKINDEYFEKRNNIA